MALFILGTRCFASRAERFQNANMRRTRIINRLHQLAVVVISGFVLVSAARAQEANISRSLDQLDTELQLMRGDSLNNDIRALLIPYREATLSSLVAARISTIPFKQGDHFNKGDTLVSFECGVLSASLQTAQAKRKQHRLTYDANQELRQQDAVSKLELALSEAKVEEGNAEVALAQAQLQKCTVPAPYNGQIVKILANEFENVEVGDPLLSILDDSKLEMTLHVPSRWLMLLNKDAKFQVALDETGKTYQAVVTRISPRIDPASRTFEVTAQILGEHEELMAGMSGSAIFGFHQ